MTLAQMQYFAAVYEYGSIIKASEMLHISQPTISMAIRDLENEFGISLFDRISKKLVPTQEGIYVYEQISDILNRIYTLTTYMHDTGTKKHPLTIGIPSIAGTFIFSTIINDFRDKYPEIALDILKCDSTSIANLLNNNTLSIGISVEKDTLNEEMQSFRILSSEFLFCVSKDHPLASKEMVSVEDLKDVPIILNDSKSYLTVEIKERFYKKNLSPNIISFAPEVALVQMMLRDNKCGAFFYRELADSIPDIVAIPLEEPLPVSFSIYWNKKAVSKRAVKALKTSKMPPKSGCFFL